MSDWHATTLQGGGRALLRLKRLSGWASWKLTRRHRHSPAILEAAFRDLRSQALDRVLVTGDLTHVSLESEFRAAAGQLEALGPPDRVFLIPGNHDCYVSVAPESSWDHWAPYLRGAEPSELDEALAEGLAWPLARDRAPGHDDYPTLRIQSGVAMIGLCSAIPTPVFRAGGQLGAVQLERLEALLARLRDRSICRIVMIHHPVAISSEPSRRALWDASALRDVIARQGAELVLHGHKHRRRVNRIPGPGGEVPVIGVPSTSEVGSRPEKRAQYHVYTVTDDPAGRAGGFRIDAEVRGYDDASESFRRVEDLPL